MFLLGLIGIIFFNKTTTKSITMKPVDHVYSNKTEYHPASYYKTNPFDEKTINRTDHPKERPANLKDADESSKVFWETSDIEIGD